jgi:molybdopterin molybdotransferase
MPPGPSSTVPSSLLTVDEHLARVLERITPLPTQPRTLLEAVGLPVARDVLAPRAVPSFDNSAMDGYAVRRTDVGSALPQRPVALTVTAEIHAGDAPPHPLAPGTAMRIMTGAPVPDGADAVVPVEWTDGAADRVSILKPPTAGEHVRRAGEDVREGDVLLRAGEVLGPRQLGLLAGVGVDRVETAPRPRVVIMSTGAELVEPGRRLGPGQIHDANSYLLTAAVRAVGAIAYRVPATADEPDAFREALDDQLVRADLVITSGGVSKGTRDVVKAVLRDDPGMWFGEVAMQPGKPQGFGLVGEHRTPLFALPGNPVSTYVSFEVYVAPALRRLVGHSPESRPLYRAELTEPVRSIPGRRQFLRGRFVADQHGSRVTPVGGPGSHLLGALAAANALIVLEEDVTGVEAGKTVPVMLLDREY